MCAGLHKWAVGNGSIICDCMLAGDHCLCDCNKVECQCMCSSASVGAFDTIPCTYWSLRVYSNITL